jgi:hypothetical protein
MDMKSLKELRLSLQGQLDDPGDSDDPVWVKSWINAVEAEIAKKERSRSQKSREKKPTAKRRRKSPEP